jgi:N utilization substance protein B
MKTTSSFRLHLQSIMGSRRKARECALQMLFAADVTDAVPDEVLHTYWTELGDTDTEEPAREFATRLAAGTLAHLDALDERIRSRAEHWRIPRMAIVDRNILRLAVYEFLHEPTPRTVAINEALEIARRFSTYEATQFINGILDAIKRDLDEEQPQEHADASELETEAETELDAEAEVGVEGESQETPDDEHSASA